MVSLHRLSQFSKPQFLFKHQTLREKQLLALSCQEINQYVSCVWFFTSREDVVGFLPFFGVAFRAIFDLAQPVHIFILSDFNVLLLDLDAQHGTTPMGS